MSYRGGRFGGSRFGGPKPVESGKEYDVQVTEISRKGDGVARVQGFIVFVKGGRVGQKTRVRVTHVGDRFATAETIDGGEQQQVEQQQVEQHQSTEQSKDITSPPVSEEEKPELQDYASSEAEEIKPEEQPPTG
jgi:predicted RNA-binding protein with TRAM domain